MLTRRQYALFLSNVCAALTARVTRSDRPLTHWRKYSPSQIRDIANDCIELYQEFNTHLVVSPDEFVVLLSGITILCDIDYACFYEFLSQMMVSINNYKHETLTQHKLTELEYTLSTDTVSLYSMMFGPDNHQSFFTGYGILADNGRIY